MYRSKKDVDKHVESLLYKLSPKDFKIRAYSIARLYYEVGDYGSCQKYVEQYLSQKSNNAAAHKLLGLAFQKLGQKEKALEQFKISLDIDPAQTATILDVCELLADEEVTMEVGRAKYWCEKAEGTFPKHPITFRLKERLLSKANPDPEALQKLLKSELAARPKDAILHARLLKHYLQTNQIKEACDHSCNVEFDNNYFTNNFAWYETLTGILKYNQLSKNDWVYQLLLLTVKEKLCHLSLTEVPNSTSKNLIQCSDYLLDYDQSIKIVSKTGPPPGYGEFHKALLQHHCGQLAFHAATYLLKKADKDQISWNDATKYSAPLMLIAWQTEPIDLKINWLSHASSHQQKAAQQWLLEGSYRCSQAGHYILANLNSSYLDLDQISQLCSGTHWRDKLFEKMFTNHDQLSKMESSYIASASFSPPAVKLPQKPDVQKYDENSQRVYPNSLHHFVWMLLNYKQISEFKCTLFDMLTSSMTSCGPETLNKLDVLAFLYCATLTAASKKGQSQIITKDKPEVIPANITHLLCSLPQMKWWDCAYKLSQNELGTEYTDIRSTLSRGIEVVRCIDNHGLDAELLCLLGRIFSSNANVTTIGEERRSFEERAILFYSAALPLLEKLKSNPTARSINKRMFDYVHKYVGPKELNNLIEESKIYVAIHHLNDCDYEKVVDLLSDLKSPQAYYHLGVAYKKIALDEKKHFKGSDKEAKYLVMLSKAKQFAYKGLHKIKETEQYQSTALYTDIQTLIEETEVLFHKTDTDLSNVCGNDSKYLSDDECDSLAYGEPLTLRSQSNTYRNVSSTPKLKKNIPNSDNYRTAIDTQILNNSHADVSHIEQLEKQIKNLQHRDNTISDFMEQTKEWFQENRKLGNQIISTINNNIENTTEQFKLLRISVGQVKEQIDECRNECKDVADLKKQIAELKKEVNKLKKPAPEQPIDDNDIYNLEEEYRNNENSTFGTQMPFPPQQVIPPFAQRFMPPFSVPSNPYLYGQNFYNLYNQFSQFPQAPTVPGAQPIFEPTRTHMNYSSVYPNPEQIYLDAAHLVPPNVTATPPIQVLPSAATSSIPPLSLAPPTTVTTTKSYAMELKDMGKSLPVNVVITSSDPLPTCTTAPQPVLSVTVPTKHIKGSPHNYQIAMPTTINDVKSAKPPVYTFPSPGSQSATIPSSTSVSSILSQKPLFMTNQLQTNIQDRSAKDIESVFSISSPNNSLNKSRTLSEKSNTSIENYDPCPDFKPIVPLPAEVKVTTGEEDEEVIFKARAKLFRFTDKQWKERGIGEMKLLKHKTTGKVRVLMRREQVHKICANHVILREMEIKPMKNETKAYFWCANDFAEETVILEKFCIRFKTADIAKDFYDTFEKARQAAATNFTNKYVTDKSKNDILVKSTPSIKEENEKSEPNKTVVGGFTFSSTPTFKPQNNEQSLSTPSKTPETKVNVFSGITFKTNNSTLQNVFNTPVSSIESAKPVGNSNTLGNSTVNKLNSSDTVEEYEPNVDFKPVVPLPALIDQKTGEEDENILFEHRAKLLRFDTATKEWKERGLGNIKVLEHKVNKKVRLLMRREQIMKICCNHVVTKEINFQKMPNMDKAVTWCAKDFSDGELVGETFCLRFKTIQACDDFLNAVKNAQFKSGDGAKAAKENENAAKVAASTCEPQKLQSSIVNTSMPTSDWGDKFKPKANSWECSVCMIRNDTSKDHCGACSTPKDPKSSDKSKSTNENSLSKFNFGLKQSNDKTENVSNASSKWGDQFKPKEGTWECQQCLVRNDGNVDNCSACNSPKDPTNVKNEPKSLFSNTAGHKFSFGIPPDANNTQSKDSKSSSLFGTKTNQKFSFGIPQNTPDKLIQQKNGSVAGEKETPKKTALLETPKGIKPIMETPKVTPFGENTSAAFDFSFTPKTSSKGKSPAKTPATDKDDDSDHVSDDEGDHIHFSPVILAPDKIKVVTGEEDEEVLYAHRAKLYIFATGEWKERGLGTVKILKHKNTGKLRVLMRREQVFKICLNHSLTPEIIYKEKDEKTWIFAANDFSEEELVMSKFCLRFSNKAVAQEFKTAVDNALGNNSNLKTNQACQDADDVVFISEIQATSEEKKLAKDLMLPENFYTYKNKHPCQGCRGCEDSDSKTDEEKESSKTVASEHKVSGTITPLKVPVSSFQSPANSFYGTPTNLGDKTVDTTVFRTPMQYYKSETCSSNNSTVSEVDSETTFSEASAKSSTLLGSNKKDTTNTKSPLTQPKFALEKPKFVESKTPNTEEKTLLSGQSSIFGGNKQTGDKSVFGENKNIFGQNTSIFGQSKPIFGENKPLFGENKTVFGENKPVFGTNKPIFGENKPVFGENKPIFGENKPVFGENQPVFGESKPIFGDSKPVFGESKSVFGESKPIFGENKSIFGENKLALNENKSIFGQNKISEFKQSTEETKSVFSGSKSVFGENKSIFGENKPAFGENKLIFGDKPVFGENKPIFGDNKSVFGDNKLIFGENTNNASATNKVNFATNSQDDKVTGSPNVSSFNTANNPTSIFGGATQKTGLNFAKKEENQLDSSKSIFSASKQFSFGSSTPEQSKIDPEIKVTSANENKSTEVLPLKVDSSLSFAVLSSGSEGFGGKKTNFQWEGAGQPLFGGAQKPAAEKLNDSTADESAPAGAEEDYDPHYEPIVPLPDEIVVTTGEEEEEKLFSQRCKLYRFDDKTKEWKERGVGELKILYHPGRKSYRLLQRREQVHKLVLNMLLFMDLELLPMKNSDRAWTWAGRNYAEAAGEHETLAVRFKSPELATAFYDKVQECIRKLQVAAAEAIRKEKEGKENEVMSVTPLRLPKHLQSSARADEAIAAKSLQAVPETQTTEKTHEPQVQFDLNTSQGDQEHEYEYENYGNEDYNDYEDYDHNENSDEYYEEEEGEMYSFGKSVLVRNGVESVCEASHIEVTYDQEVGMPKIIVTDANTGEILASTRIEADTEFTLSENICSWSGVDITTDSRVETSAKIEFNDTDKAMEFYDYCETSKAGTYTVENET